MRGCIVYHGTNSKDLENRIDIKGNFYKTDMWYTYNKDYAVGIARKRAAEYNSSPVIISLDSSLLGSFIDPVEDGKANIAHYVKAVPKGKYKICSM